MIKEGINVEGISCEQELSHVNIAQTKIYHERGLLNNIIEEEIQDIFNVILETALRNIRQICVNYKYIILADIETTIKMLVSAHEHKVFMEERMICTPISFVTEEKEKNMRVYIVDTYIKKERGANVSYALDYLVEWGDKTIDWGNLEYQKNQWEIQDTINLGEELL